MLCSSSLLVSSSSVVERYSSLRLCSSSLAARRSSSWSIMIVAHALDALLGMMQLARGRARDRVRCGVCSLARLPPRRRLAGVEKRDQDVRGRAATCSRCCTRTAIRRDAAVELYAARTPRACGVGRVERAMQQRRAARRAARAGRGPSARRASGPPRCWKNRAAEADRCKTFHRSSTRTLGGATSSSAARCSSAGAGLNSARAGSPSRRTARPARSCTPRISGTAGSRRHRPGGGRCGASCRRRGTVRSCGGLRRPEEEVAPVSRQA